MYDIAVPVNFQITDGRALSIMMRVQHSGRARLQQEELWRASCCGRHSLLDFSPASKRESVSTWETTNGVLVEGCGCHFALSEKYQTCEDVRCVWFCECASILLCSMVVAPQF